MFKTNDVVKVLIPNVINSGYDYRLDAPAAIGRLVRVSVMNKPYVGVIIGTGDWGLGIEKIKSAEPIGDWALGTGDLEWIYKMSEWTMMPPGAVLRLILNVPNVFEAKGEKRKAKNEYEYFDTGNVKLNEEQVAAANAIVISSPPLDGSGFQVYVLDGITGSGKTQVYFDAVWRTYNAGKSVLLMMPEIALTAQFIKRFENRFGYPPVVWHSNLTPAQRRDIWRGVANGKIRIVIGTRSALFLPWQNLGLIVVDEEHDGSYKQEEQGNYHARDMAILRAAICKFPIILASATPSVETMKNIASGKYKLLKLTRRFGGAALPKIETIDMRKNKSLEFRVESLDNNQDLTHLNSKLSNLNSLSPTLCTAIGETLAAGHQIMLFINRRGFAQIAQCKNCGWIMTCPDCSVGMNFHKKKNSLMCHICGRTAPMPKVCPTCKNEILMHNFGVEKLEEEVRSIFPNARTAIVSSDTMQSHRALETVISQMESGDIDIVIGTQILAKGHHFPNLTLVAAVDADMGLYDSDFRSGEKTFQQLFQVAGRAGRDKIPGRVMLQTYQPEHPVLRALCEYNRDAFMAGDMAARRAAGAPPYGQYIAIIVESQKENILQDYCKKLSDLAPILKPSSVIHNTSSMKIMGPIPAPMYQVRNWYRMRFLVIGDESASLQPAVRAWLAKVKQPANVRVKIDVGPQNFV